MKALIRHLTVGGTDDAILIGLTVNALTGYSPATTSEVRELTTRGNAEKKAA